MNRIVLPLFSIIVSFILFSCSDSEDQPPQLANLVFNVSPSTDGSGLVNFFAEAENAVYYEFFTGDENAPGPFRSTSGFFSHTYTSDGNYTARVQAHLNEETFITSSRVIEMSFDVSFPTDGFQSPKSYDGMELVWEEEFEGTTLNPDHWTAQIGDGCPDLCGWGNQELQFYTAENFKLQDGYLVIEAKQENRGNRNYTSSRLITQDKVSFQYGRIDIRALMPRGQGMWPALWMLGQNIDEVGWPACGEIDIMEMVGGDGRENTVHGTLHWDNNGRWANFGGSYTLSSGTLADKFHVYSIEWDAEKVVWFLDGVQYHEIDIRPAGLSEFREPFFFILNVAVGGTWPGSPNSSTNFPQMMVVDYIRVFQEQ